jgi:hypothetical protein
VKSVIQRNNLPPILIAATWKPAIYNNMDEAREHMLSKISQTWKDKYCLISIVYRILKIKLTGTEHRWIGSEGCGKWEILVKGYKLSVIK